MMFSVAINGSSLSRCFADNLRVNNKPVGHIAVKIQNSVNSQERLRNADPLVGGIVERTLKPLRRSRDAGIQAVHDHVTGQRRDAFAAHRVALICHCRRTDLILFKRFFHFLQMLKQTDVVGEFCGALRDSAENGKNAAVLLAGIGLAGNRKAVLESPSFSQ